MGNVCAFIKKSSDPYMTRNEKNSYMSNEMISNENSKLLNFECMPCSEDNNRKPGNPGTWEELHKKVTDLYPVNFEGLQLIVKRRLNEHLNVKHIMTLSSKTPTGYKFEVNYIGMQHVEPHEKYPIISGSITPNGNMSCFLAHSFACRFRMKLFTQIKDMRQCKTCNSTLEYRSDDCTVSAKLANIDLLKQQGTFNVQYLQSLSSRIALGAELECLRESHFPNGYRTAMSAAFRYSTGLRTLSAIIGESGLHVCYHHIANRQLQLGIELETDIRMHRTFSQIVYRVDLPSAQMVFKGIVNSEWSIGGILEKKLEPIPAASLLLSCLLNHKEERLFVGIGLNIG